MELILFVLAAAGALAGGVGVIASRLPVRSALALLLVLGSLSVLYLLLDAQFIAALQVIIYAGAIVVLFLFVIMLLHARSGEARTEKLRGQRTAAYLLAAGFLVAIAAVLATRPASEPSALPAGFGTAQAVGASLYTGYVLPFELASIILLVGIVAAVVIGAPAGGTR
jgi:NADH-quinone oxidoreductase subunit J